MKTSNIRQKGFGLVDTLLSLIVISIFTLFIMQGALLLAEKSKAQAFAKHVEKVITSVQGYHYFRDSNRITTDPVQMWPASLDALVTDYNSRYWIACSIAEAQAGKCKRPEYTPFISKISYAVIDANTARLFIPTIRLGEQQKRWNSYLLQIPFAKQNASGDIEISIYPPMNSTAYNEFLRKDGTTKLTGDWDIGGNYAIVNAKGMTVRNSDGSQMPIGGAVSVRVSKNGDRVDKPACPTPLTAQITAIPMGQYHATKPLPFIGNNSVLAKDQGNYWVVTMEYAAHIDGEDKWERRHDGDISVTVYCLAQ